MKLSIPVYVVGLVAAFLYGLLKFYVPTLPFSVDQVLYVILAILALLHIDVVQALKSKGLL